jgi:hypothetical protein
MSKATWRRISNGASTKTHKFDRVRDALTYSDARRVSGELMRKRRAGEHSVF